MGSVMLLDRFSVNICIWGVSVPEIRRSNRDNLRIVFYISALIHILWPSLEPSRWDGSNEGLQHTFLWTGKIITELSSKPHPFSQEFWSDLISVRVFSYPFQLTGIAIALLLALVFMMLALAECWCCTLKCLKIGTPKAINFPFCSKWKNVF